MQKNRDVKASIDIGTNTALLLVAEVGRTELEVLRDEQRIPRLGTNVDKVRRLSKEAMERVIKVLKEYQEIVEQNFPDIDTITVTATSAVRDAQNRKQFRDLVRKETGLEIDVLSGVEEARYTFLGAQSVLDNINKEQQKVVIDIGGGSTEIATGRNQQLGERYSYDMGCVRFTERFLQDDPPNKGQIAQCRNTVRKVLKEYEFNFESDAKLIGVAGTVTSLAFIDKGLSRYTPKVISGHVTARSRISNIIQDLVQRPSKELLDRYPTVMKGRADIFLAGLLILEGFMSRYDFDELVTSTGGIRHGVILGL